MQFQSCGGHGGPVSSTEKEDKACHVSKETCL